ncbi:MAG: hypothetical protein LBT46_04165, partial [Planctomycetaceae bacterium]|nr:hypothetical protein [Planctomycetaceae bacterium]
GVLGGGAGLVIGTMIARKIVLENPNLTTHEITNTTSFSGPFGISLAVLPTEWAERPTTEGFAVLLVITLLFTVFGAFIGNKIGKK